MQIRIFEMLNLINSKLSNLERNVSKLDEKLEFSIQLMRNQLIRVKHGEDIDDSTILMGRPYNDLSPIKAFEIYQNQDIDFVVLDVSSKEFKSKTHIAESVSIPLDELDKRCHEIMNKTTPILIISEDGLKSIQACELLVKKGYFNVNNISGGHEFWPGNKEESLSQSA